MTDTDSPYGVLFVCSGNICRSPTADGIFRALVEEAGLSDRFTIDSAGTHGLHQGEPPDPRAVEMARDYGVDLSPLRARKFLPVDYANFDLILAMDYSHYDALAAHLPQGARAELRMFLSDIQDELGVEEVPDPWYGGTEDFAHAWDLIYKGSEALFRKLTQETS